MKAKYKRYDNQSNRLVNTITSVLQLFKQEDPLRSPYTLKARLALRPRARSNFLPLDRTYGLVELLGTPGALPMCRQASRAVRRPCTSNVFFPVGALRAS